ncbi:hypothetical protein [Bacillus sp. PK3_68]|uniref:hypothetical protein n=1 Tax=Bacillus sp. PK3_68 TaxID=2027408 RepID=UPI000E76B708|nr:hypothetical protein [Bacillus sp. PK3_68]RJS60094.1 hypothetical protein CJ483_08490 [Bacillus sp. PK3_68]
MRRVLENFKKYSSNIVLNKEYEDFSSYTLSVEIADIKMNFQWEDLEYFTTFINDRDRTSLNVTVNDGEPFLFKFTDDFEGQDVTSILESINQIVDEESIVKIEYTVFKVRENSVLSIYNIGRFNSYLGSLKILPLLKQLQKNLDFTVLNKFEMQENKESKIYFQSSLMIFAPKEKLHSIDIHPEREFRRDVLKKRQYSTNPQSFSDFEIIPNDFDNVNSDKSAPNGIVTIFDKLKIIFSASFLANTSDITRDNLIKLGVIGHKYIDSTVSFQNFREDSAEIFYHIYQWVYEQGDTHDKLDLSRNIISRYLTTSGDSWILPKDTLSSIQSAHAIYLKENVEKYIETKNKVSEITNELSIKSKEISQHFISSFKNNNITIMTYFISIFVFNSLAFNSIQKVFSKEKFYLSVAFLFVSCIHLVITNLQTNRDIRLNIKYYFAMKRIYKDIFDVHELNALFHKRQLKYNIKNIKDTMHFYTLLWVIEIFLLFALTIFLTFFI